MKKTLSIFLSLIILCTSLCLPASFSFAATYEPDRKIYAESYLLINLDDDSFPVVAEKNSTERLYPASLTKIVTAIVTLNNVKDLKQKTKMSQAAYDRLLGTGAQVAGIEVGEELSIEELLYLTMVYSACDACQVLAEFVAGSEEAFVQKMNEWVKSIGCNDTHFVNPDGLHSAEHYSTAKDFATITIEALKNADFTRIATTESINFHDMKLPHTNLMLHPGYVTYYYEYAQGIKTGSTEEAEYCVITKAAKDGYNYLAVVMKSPQQAINGESYLTKCSFVDAKALFEWAFDSLKYSTIVAESEVVGEVDVEDGKDADSVQLVAKRDTNVIVPAGLDKSAIIYELPDKPASISAPVAKGQDVCKANVIYGDEIIATVDLVAAETVELSTFLKVINAIKAFFSMLIVKIICIIIIVVMVCYVVLVIMNNNKKKKRRQKRAQRAESRDKDDLPPPQPPIRK